MIVELCIAIIIILFIVIVVIGWYATRRQDNTNTLPMKEGELLSSCASDTCTGGLICDPTEFVCKLPIGATCTNGAMCVSGTYCSGKCTNLPNGLLDQPCPCNNGLLCVPQSSGLNVCKGATGYSCTSGSQCASSFCSPSGVCVGGFPNSHRCSANSDCFSNNCSFGFCQNPGITTGQAGSACAGSCVSFIGSTCASTPGSPLTCACSQPNTPGICSRATQGINSPCQQGTNCVNQLVCTNNTANACMVGNANCSCIFPYNNPNTHLIDTQCITGMSPIAGVSGCFNDSGLGCSIGGQCVNGACGGQSVLAAYRFAQNGNISNIVFANSTNTSITKILNGYSDTNIPSMRRMFTTSLGFLDTIYVVDNNLGFWEMQYNVGQDRVSVPWRRRFPPVSTSTINGVTSTRTLIDVNHNGTYFLYAFHEVLTGAQTGANDTLYISTANTTTGLTPYNYQPGSGITGTQYMGTTPLSIEYIDISKANFVSPGGDVLIAYNGTVYVKPFNQPKYNIGVIRGGLRNGSAMVNIRGSPRFYLSGGPGEPIVCPSTNPSVPSNCASYDNIAFVGALTTIGQEILQFSGNFAGATFGIDRFNQVEYRIFNFDFNKSQMELANIIMLAGIFQSNILIDNVVLLARDSAATPIPYRISQTSVGASSENMYYMMSTASCS